MPSKMSLKAKKLYKNVDLTLRYHLEDREFKSKRTDTTYLLNIWFI